MTNNIFAALSGLGIAFIVLAVLVLAGGWIFAYFYARKKAVKKSDNKQTEKTEQPAEPVVQPVVQPVEVAEDGDDTEDKDDDDDESDVEVAPEKRVARIDGHVRYIIIKYKKSFTAKLIQSQDAVKDYYSELKNELLSYKGVKSRISWRLETFSSGRVQLAKMSIRGKNLALFLPLDPKKYEDSKYIVDDKSEVAAYGKTPCLYRIKNDRRVKYAKELIAEVMQEREKVQDFAATDYKAQYPYEEIKPLLERGLVKELTEEDAQSGDVFKPRQQVGVSEADELLQDDIAVALIEETEEISDKTKTGIINIDTLAKYFEDGEEANLEEIKKRVPDFNKKTTYLKVLARGTLDKKLTVVADAYSLEAAKMILLTGGNAVKKRGF